MNFIFKLFGWFFSNLLLIIIVVAACYAFVYWDDPFGEETPVGKVMAAFPKQTDMVKSFVDDLMVDDDSKVVAQGGTSSTSVASSDSSAGEEAGSEADTASGSAAEADDSGTVAASFATNDVVSQSSGLAVEPDSTMKVQAPEGDSAFVPREIEQKLNRIKDDGQFIAGAGDTAGTDAGTAGAGTGAGAGAGADTAGTDDVAAAGDAGTSPVAEAPAETAGSEAAPTAGDDARSLMIDARKAFYRRDYETSVASYEKLIGMQKDNIDALGELGNVYFNQGKMQQAADAYYQAATIMIAQGQSRRASGLIGFLRSVDESKAEQLRESIEASRDKPESL